MMCYQFITIKCFITVEQPFRIHQVIFCLALLTTGFIPKFCTGILNYSPKYLFFFFLLKVCPPEQKLSHFKCNFKIAYTIFFKIQRTYSFIPLPAVMNQIYVNYFCKEQQVELISIKGW